MESFKDQYKNKICYVLGTGPSLDQFHITDKTAIYFGMNTCYLYPNIAPHLDVLVAEYFYNNEICHKLDSNINNKPRFIKKKLVSLIDPTIPIFYDNRSPPNVRALVNNSKFTNKHAHDIIFLKDVIGYSPGVTFYDGIASTAFLTVLFAAYTGVSEIRIVGCDCTGYAERLLPGWVILKEILDTRYPNIHISATGKLSDIFNLKS